MAEDISGIYKVFDDDESDTVYMVVLKDVRQRSDVFKDEAYDFLIIFPDGKCMVHEGSNISKTGEDRFEKLTSGDFGPVLRSLVDQIVK